MIAMKQEWNLRPQASRQHARDDFMLRSSHVLADWLPPPHRQPPVELNINYIMKCKTTTILRATGALEKIAYFPNSLSLQRLRSLTVLVGVTGLSWICLSIMDISPTRLLTSASTSSSVLPVVVLPGNVVQVLEYF